MLDHRRLRVPRPPIPSLRGRYVYADFCGGQIRSLIPDVPNARGDEPVGLPTQRGISSFGEDAKGNLYFTNLYSGGVYEIVSGRERSPGLAEANVAREGLCALPLDISEREDVVAVAVEAGRTSRGLRDQAAAVGELQHLPSSAAVGGSGVSRCCRVRYHQDRHISGC